MENDVLKNRIVPWQEKGRWYHGIYDPVSQQLITEKCDPELLTNFTVRIASNLVYISHNIKPIIDIKIKSEYNVPPDSVQNVQIGVRRHYTDGTIGLLFCDTRLKSKTEFWLFV